MHYELYQSKNGQPYLGLIQDDGKTVRLHSAYDPSTETAKTVETFSAGRSNYIIAAGLALGYHIKYLSEKYPAHKIIVIEKDSAVVDICRKTNITGQLKFDIIQNISDMTKVLDKIDPVSFIGIAKYYHRSSYALYPDFYDMIINDANKYISSKMSDLLTRFEFEEKWVKNIIKNLQVLNRTKPAKSYFNRFRGIPGIIVSAGPSLRKNVKFLEQMKDKAVIASVDTAFPVLHKYKIHPHFVMVLDAQKYSIKHFLGTDTSETILLADMVSCPSVLQQYKGLKLVSTTTKIFFDEDDNSYRETTPFMEWIEKHIEPIGDIQSGGSVATSLFDFLLNLGCSPIILIGQDLAYTGREIHSSGTYHNDDWLPSTTRFLNLDTINQKVIRKRKIKYVDSYGHNGKVISDFVLNLYREWFEDSISKVPFKVINSTEGGAYINGAVEQSLESLVKMRNVNVINTLEKIDSASSNIDTALINEKLKIALEKISLIKNSIISNTYNNYDDLNKIISDDCIASFYRVFIKKTMSKILRNPEIADDKKYQMLKDDILRSSSELELLIKESLEKLK